jgi:general secretion pathway protein A
MLGIMARHCIQHPGTEIVLRGYTDATGVRGYNIKLAEFRADMVKTYLVGRGVPDNSITTLAIGPGTEGPGNTTIPPDGVRRKVVIQIIPPNE